MFKEYDSLSGPELEKLGRKKAIQELYRDGDVDRAVVEKELQTLGFSKDKATAEHKSGTTK